MAENYVQPPPNDAAGPKLGTNTVTNGNGDVVNRQEINITDPSTNAAKAAVKNSAPAAGDYGVVVRDVGGAQESTLSAINTATGAQADAESSSGNGSVIGILKRLRTLFSGGLPAALSGSGNLKTAIQEAIPAGTNNIGDVDVLTLPATTNAGATAKTADYDTGAGTDTTTMFGIALPKAGGAVPGGTSTDPIRTDPTGTTVQPVSASSLPLPTGAATETTLGTRLSESDFDSKTGSLTETAPTTDTASSGLNGRLQRIAQRITSLITSLTDGSARIGGTVAVSAASLPLPSGAATETTVGTRLSESDFDTKIGSLTETAPATDTASSGLNGRLQRIAQRLTSLIALLPSALTGSGNLKVALVESTITETVQDLPVTSGGLSTSVTISAASTNATSVKASAGQLYAVQVFNTNAAARYLKLYNKASAPTVGTDTPVKVITIPGNTAGGGVAVEFSKGVTFGTGLAFALTTGAPHTDTGAVAANEIVVNLDYK